MIYGLTYCHLCFLLLFELALAIDCLLRAGYYYLLLCLCEAPVVLFFERCICFYLEFFYLMHMQEPLKLDVVISFPDHGFHLRFDPWSQVLYFFPIHLASNVESLFGESLR